MKAKHAIPGALVLATAIGGGVLAFLQANGTNLNSGFSRASEVQVPHSTIVFQAKNPPFQPNENFKVDICVDTQNDPGFVVTGADIKFTIPPSSGATLVDLDTNTAHFKTITNKDINKNTGSISLSMSNTTIKDAEGKPVGVTGTACFATMTLKAAKAGTIDVAAAFESATNTTDTNIIGFDKNQTVASQVPRERFIIKPETTAITISAAATPGPTQCVKVGCYQQYCVNADSAIAKRNYKNCGNKPSLTACYTTATCAVQANGKCDWSDKATIRVCAKAAPGADLPQCEPSDTTAQSGTAPFTVSLFGGSSPGATEASISAYQWNFDGTGDWDKNTNTNPIEYTYTKAGVFTPLYRVRDAAGKWSDTCTYASTITVAASATPVPTTRPTPTPKLSQKCGEGGNTCPAGQICYQPPMPTCPEGLACPQVMPTPYCQPAPAKPTPTPTPYPKPTIQSSVNLDNVSLTFSTTTAKNADRLGLFTEAAATKPTYELYLNGKNTTPNPAPTQGTVVFDKVKPGTYIARYQTKADGDYKTLAEASLSVNPYINLYLTRKNDVGEQVTLGAKQLIEVSFQYNNTAALLGGGKVVTNNGRIARLVVPIPANWPTTAGKLTFYIRNASSFPIKRTVNFTPGDTNFSFRSIYFSAIGDVYPITGRDEAINTFDYTELLRNFGTAVLHQPTDLNRDGVVNARDLQLLLNHMGSTSTVKWPLSPTAFTTEGAAETPDTVTEADVPAETPAQE